MRPGPPGGFEYGEISGAECRNRLPQRELPVTGRRLGALVLTGFAIVALAVAGASLLPVSSSLPPCLKDWTSPSTWQPRSSAFATTTFGLGAGRVRICYSRPAARGRTIYGGLVPWGQLWRFGANEPTRLYTTVPVAVAGVALEPGRYSLMAVPEPEAWTIAVNRSTFHWGNDLSARVLAREIGRGSVPADTLPLQLPVELLTMTAQAGTADTTWLVVDWDRTRVRIPLVPR